MNERTLFIVAALGVALAIVANCTLPMSPWMLHTRVERLERIIDMLADCACEECEHR